MCEWCLNRSFCGRDRDRDSEPLSRACGTHNSCSIVMVLAFYCGHMFVLCSWEGVCLCRLVYQHGAMHTKVLGFGCVNEESCTHSIHQVNKSCVHAHT